MDMLDIKKATIEGDIKVVCCNCGKHLRGRSDALLISHGYCEACCEEWLKGIDDEDSKPF